MMASVRFKEEVSNLFIVANGMIQGCVLAPLLFVSYFSVMPETVFENIKEGVRLVFRTIGELFNQQHFKART